MEVNTTDHASTSTPLPQANVEIHANVDATNQIEETGSPPSQIQVNVKIVFSPGSRKYYVPICEPSLKPYIGQRFPDLDMGIEFYRRYAANCGFDIRLGTSRRARDGSIKNKYVYCSREGEKYTTPAGKSSDIQAQKSTTSKCNDVQSEKSPINKSNDMQVEKSTRNRPTTRLGCEARIIFDISTYSTYVVTIFEEQHNHPLCSERYRQFLKTNRNMNPGHQSFVLNCAKVNMGQTKSYRLYREIVGDYSSIGCTSVEFKNFGRDLKAYTEGCDAQMILDNLCSKHANDQLTRLFWADPISRNNYAAFGDVVSFDATYSTNRYNLIFTPFTGIDNHRRIVTFGAGLLSKENSDSYAWLIGKFKECMGRQPLMITTDQDPGMRKAIESVLPDTRHRYCMWHIDKKITERVPHCKNAESSFRAKINEVIWSDLLEPAEFEKAWGDVLTEFNLNNHTWLEKIFEVRHNWIPAYFRDNPMSGLARTTSISESVNSFFDKYLNRSSNLVEFFMKYDNAIAAQRHAQDKLNSETTIYVPAMKTQLPIERHAMELYTSRIFIDVQEEISAACFTCTILAICNEGSSCAYQINDDTSTVDVVYDSVEDSYTCSCRKYVRWGLLCRHIFVLFKDRKVRVIPDKYIVSRWTKNALNNVSLASGLNIIEKTDPLEKHKIVLGQWYSEFYHTIGVVGNDTETFESIMRSLKDHRESKSNVDKSQNTKRRLFEDHFGAQVPDKGSVTIHPPALVHNKGSGKRIKSAAEIAFENSKKPLRLCKKCNQRTNHDSRNCDKFTGSANRMTDTNTDVSL